MRRIPYARLKSIVKPAYNLPGITTGDTLDACAKGPRLLSGIRRLAHLVAGAGARLYKEHAFGQREFGKHFTIWKEDVYEIAEVARRACRRERGAGGLRHVRRNRSDDQGDHQDWHRSAGQRFRRLGWTTDPEWRQAGRQADRESVRGLEPLRCLFHPGVVPAG